MTATRSIGLTAGVLILLAIVWTLALTWRRHARTVAIAVAEHAVGADLRRLPSGQRDQLIAGLRRLVGSDDLWKRSGDGAPHRLLAWKTGATRWLLVVSYPGLHVPDVSWIALQPFDADWRPRPISGFPTGYRMALLDVWQQRDSPLQLPLLVARVQPNPSAGDWDFLQYYVVREDRAVLVRFQVEGGELARACYRAKEPWTGPVPPRRSADEWIDLLRHDDPVDVLECLTWLGASHLPSSEPRSPQVNQESLEDARRCERVRDDPRTAALVQGLRDSANVWIRDAAALAAWRD